MKSILPILLFTVIGTHCANILVVDPVASFSHFIIPFKLAKELASRGHHVTCINSFPQKTKLENYEDIPVTQNVPLMKKMQQQLFARKNMTILESMTTLFDFVTMMVNSTIHNNNVQELLKSERQFDAVIIESFFQEAFVGFSYHFKAPTILISTHAPSPMNNYIFANPSPLSYIAGIGDLSSHMNFWERIQNFFQFHVFNTILHFYHLPKQREIFKSFTQEVELDDVLYNTSLLLTNSHVSFYQAVPLVPNIIEIGGFHIEPKPLSQDLQKFLDECKEGVVLFSMGSNLKSEDLKPETKTILLTAFSKLKEKVLWKFETEFDVPENVKIMPWIPQQDVLAHPNVKAFITHGGRMSTIEAVYFGVPIIGVPVFADQPSNILEAVNAGYAIKLNLDDLTEEELSNALSEILTNPKYKESVKKRSELLHDRPMKPMDSAVYWVEHVIKHKGAPHLRSSGVHLKWYQREMIDVVAFLIISLIAVVTVIFTFVRKLLKCLFPKKKTNLKKKRQ